MGPKIDPWEVIDSCPFCHGHDCLVGHGSYNRKGLGGMGSEFKPYPVPRFLCTREGRTISILPAFVHRYKRFAFGFAMWCLWRRLHEGNTIYATARYAGVAWKTIRQWQAGLESNADAKIACFPQLGSVIASGKQIGVAILSHFKVFLGCGRLGDGSRTGMIRLYHDYECRVY